MSVVQNQLRYWQVQVTMSDDGDNRYRRNRTFGVISLTAEDAIEQVRAAYPAATVWAVQHRGTVDFGIVRETIGYHESDYNK